jgi:hypothetical protein
VGLVQFYLVFAFNAPWAETAGPCFRANTSLSHGSSNFKFRLALVIYPGEMRGLTELGVRWLTPLERIYDLIDQTLAALSSAVFVFQSWLLMVQPV